MKQGICNYLLRLVAILTAGFSLTACGGGGGSGAATADGPHSYAGDTITVIIGLDPSAGGSTVGRLIAKHLETHLESESRRAERVLSSKVA